VTANTIVILKRNLAILTISGASVVTKGTFQSPPKIFSQKGFFTSLVSVVVLQSGKIQSSHQILLSQVHSKLFSHTIFLSSCPSIFCSFTKQPNHKSSCIQTHSLNISLPTAFFPAPRLMIVSLLIAGSKACSKRSSA